VGLPFFVFDRVSDSTDINDRSTDSSGYYNNKEKDRRRVREHAPITRRTLLGGAREKERDGNNNNYRKPPPRNKRENIYITERELSRDLRAFLFLARLVHLKEETLTCIFIFFDCLLNKDICPFSFVSFIYTPRVSISQC
jgi:hypothetical protein